MRHPLPVGTRVHHAACVWSYGFTEAERQARPNWGWGIIESIHSGPYSDGSFEYNVRYDAPMFDEGRPVTQWPSYHIDQAEAPSRLAIPADYDAVMRAGEGGDV